MKIRSQWVILVLVAFALKQTEAQETWPKIINATDAVITIYQPDVESLEGNLMKVRAAVSVKGTAAKEPVFGVMWGDVTLTTDRDERIATLEKIVVTDVRFPNNPDAAKVQRFKEVVQAEVPKWNYEISLDRLAATLEQNEAQMVTAENLNMSPPKILYAKKPTVLVLIDGDPKMQPFNKTELKQVVNTQFLLFLDESVKQYWLNGNGLWFVSSDLKSGWKQSDALSKEVKTAEAQLRKDGKIANSDTVSKDVIPEILVSTESAELIQTEGEPDMASIKGTNLLYAKNSENYIFLDINSQKYYVLISGRWFSASKLDGAYAHVASDKLPADFARIPKGSEMDIVLASVAGTPEAKDAMLDAQLPQTAAVDRKTATTTVEYDGQAQFEKVEGTDDLYYAPNTSSTVLKEGTKYYAVDNGIWYESDSPNGPWRVSATRPEDVDDIEPSSPVYNVKYVYIYDATPDVVYVGYTPGYMGCYVYGPTVVYGTGYYYNPWYGTYYYPRPVTYGYTMTYNPWTGWSFGFSYGWGSPYTWCSWGWSGWYGHPYHPCWGPYRYYPPYHVRYNSYYGPRPAPYNDRRYVYEQNRYPSANTQINKSANKGNNIYTGRQGVSAGKINQNERPNAGNSVQKPAGGATAGAAGSGGSRQQTASKNNTKNNVYSDKDGNVYRGDGNNFQQYNGQDWSKPQQSNTGSRPQQPNTGATKAQPSQPNNSQQMQQQSQDRSRGQQRTQNYQNYNGSMSRSGGASMSRPAGGGARPGGR